MPLSFYFTQLNTYHYIKLNEYLFLFVLCFLINTLYAYYYNYTLYATLFLNLTLTSLYYHSTYTPLSNILDKTAIASVVLYGGQLFITKLFTPSINSISILLKLAIPLTFLTTNYIYFYGKSHDPHVGNTFHSILHLVSSLGHLLIIIL